MSGLPAPSNPRNPHDPNRDALLLVAVLIIAALTLWRTGLLGELSLEGLRERQARPNHNLSTKTGELQGLMVALEVLVEC